MGDYSTNIPFLVARKEKTDPFKKAEEIAEELRNDAELAHVFSKIEPARPGYVNLTINTSYLQNSIKEIFRAGDDYGASDLGRGKKINLEFVSANPTGPLTIGNARSASYGDALANVLKKSGYKVAREYYINDVGVQVGKMAESVRLRMKELQGERIDFPEDLYQGEYVKEIAADFLEKGVADDQIGPEAIKEMIERIRKALAALGVVYDEWFPESKLHESGEVAQALKQLEDAGHVFEEDGAKWLRISEDQKAVLVKSNGATTYLMNDIAYTKNKFERGFDKAINIWGTDHHGDKPRLEAGVAALGYPKERLEVLLYQLVTLKINDQKVKISKRAGNVVLVEDLIKEINRDAIRYFFLAKDLNTHMELDVELAKQESKQNPVYYIQYAFARLNSIFSKLPGQAVEPAAANLSLLKEDEELRLLRKMVRFPELIEDMAKTYQVHHLAQYMYDLASLFHKSYEKHRIIGEDAALQTARAALAGAVRIVLADCLSLAGLTAPEKMEG